MWHSAPCGFVTSGMGALSVRQLAEWYAPSFASWTKQAATDECLSVSAPLSKVWTPCSTSLLALPSSGLPLRSCFIRSKQREYWQPGQLLSLSVARPSTTGWWLASSRGTKISIASSRFLIRGAQMRDALQVRAASSKKKEKILCHIPAYCRTHDSLLLSHRWRLPATSQRRTGARSSTRQSHASHVQPDPMLTVWQVTGREKTCVHHTLVQRLREGLGNWAHLDPTYIRPSRSVHRTSRQVANLREDVDARPDNVSLVRRSSLEIRTEGNSIDD